MLNPNRTIRPPGSATGLRAPQSGSHQSNINGNARSNIVSNKLRFSSPIQISSNKSATLIGLARPSSGSSAIPQRRLPMSTQTPKPTSQVTPIRLPQPVVNRKSSRISGESRLPSNSSTPRSAVSHFQSRSRLAATSANGDLKIKATQSIEVKKSLPILEPKKEMNNIIIEQNNESKKVQSVDIDQIESDSAVNLSSNKSILPDIPDQRSRIDHEIEKQLNTTTMNETNEDQINSRDFVELCPAGTDQQTIVREEILDSVRDIYQLCEKLKVQLEYESDLRKALEEKNRQLMLVIEKQKQDIDHDQT